MDRSLVSRATEGTEAPTPGYLYLDIAKNAAASPVACQEIAQYLTRRLGSKNNHNIKYKCLKVIAKTAESPLTRGHFKRILSQDSNMMTPIKEALQFRGPPDPARGDQIYERVRTAAKETLDAIYSDTPTSTQQETPSYGGIGSSYQPSPYGRGPPPGAPPSQSSLGTGRRMEGIGNPMYKDPRLEPQPGNMTVKDLVKEAGETIVGMIKDPLARNVGTGPGHGGMGQNYGPPGRNQLSATTGGQWTMASNRGPNAFGSSSGGGGGGYSGSGSGGYPGAGGGSGGYPGRGGYGASTAPPPGGNNSYSRARDANAFQWAQGSTNSGATPSTGGVGGSWASQSVASQAREAPHPGSNPSGPYVGVTHSVATMTRGGGGTAQSDGTYEKNLVLELCPPGGMKAEPPPDKLDNFAKTVPSLNPDLVCPALLDCLEEGQPWIIRAKALCVMETCISVCEHHKVDGANKYADFFFTCRGEIEPLANHPRAAIKEPAKRVLTLLGVTPALDPATSAPPPAAAPPVPVAPAADLLDFGSDEPTAPPPAAAPPEAPPAPSAVPPAPSSLFGGLTTKDASPAAPPPSAPVAVAAGLFDAMTVNDTAAPKADAPAAPAPAPSAFDFVQSERAPAAPAPAASGFEFMAADKPVVTSTEPAAAAPAPAQTTGSAFGFITTSSAPAPPAAAAAPAGSMSKDSFDPLNNGYKPSPSTQKKMMDAAAIQMMYAQQQNMMMMQQMQQMQMMAMQQQAGMRGMPPPSAGNVMAGAGKAGMAATSSFSFLDVGAQPPSKKKEDKTFDFINAAVQSEKKK